MSEVSSITRYGNTEPFGLQVSRGQIAWHNAITVWGYNPDVDTAVETVWGDGGTIPFIGAAATMNVSSSSTNDAASGTGARTIVIQGLDANHNEISETVTLNGQTTVTTTKQFLHINYIYVATTGSGKANDGSIYVGAGVNTLGVPATVYGVVYVGLNASTTACYTVPAGYTAYVVNGGISVGQPSGSNGATGYLLTRDPTADIARVVAASSFNNGTAEYDFALPLRIPEKYSLEARAFGASNNNSVSAHFQLILIKNDA